MTINSQPSDITAIGDDDNVGLRLHLDAMVHPAGRLQVLGVDIGGVSNGARLSAGYDHGDGIWSLTHAALKDLRVIPPLSGNDLSLRVSVTAIEAGTGDTLISSATTTAAFRAGGGDPVAVVPACEYSEIRLRLTGQQRPAGPKFWVEVNGVRIGRINEVIADAAKGQWQQFVIRGDFGVMGPSKVELKCVDDKSDWAALRINSIHIIGRKYRGGRGFEPVTQADAPGLQSAFC